MIGQLDDQRRAGIEAFRQSPLGIGFQTTKEPGKNNLGESIENSPAFQPSAE